MTFIPNLIAQLGGRKHVARRLRLGSASTVVAWIHRGSIPIAYWPGLIALARKAKIPGVTPETLLRAHSRRQSTQTASSRQKNPRRPSHATRDVTMQ